MYVSPKDAARIQARKRAAYGHKVEASAKVPTENDKRVAANLAVQRMARAVKK